MLLSPSINVQTPSPADLQQTAIHHLATRSERNPKVKFALVAGLSFGSLYFATHLLRALKACPSLIFATVFLTVTQVPFDVLRAKLGPNQDFEDELYQAIHELLAEGLATDQKIEAAFEQLQNLERKANLMASSGYAAIPQIDLASFVQVDQSAAVVQEAVMLRKAIKAVTEEAATTCTNACKTIQASVKEDELSGLLVLYAVVNPLRPPSPSPSPKFRDRQLRNSWSPSMSSFANTQPVAESPSVTLRRRRSEHIHFNNSPKIHNASSSSTLRHSTSSLPVPTSPKTAPLSLHNDSASIPSLQPAFSESQYLNSAYSNAISTPPRFVRRGSAKPRPLSLGTPPGMRRAAVSPSRLDVSSPLRRSRSQSAHPDVDLSQAEEELSISRLRDGFEHMHRERRRVLCHFLAMDETQPNSEMIKVANTVKTCMVDSRRRVQMAMDDELLKTPTHERDLRNFPGGWSPIMSRSTSREETSEADVEKRKPRANKRMSLLSSARQSVSYRHSFDNLSTSSSAPASKTGFAPPSDPLAHQKESYEAFGDRVKNMGIGLRTVATKLNMTSEDLRSTLPSAPNETSSVQDTDRLLAIHDSVRADLEALLRDFDEQRLLLRKLTKPAPPPLARRGSHFPSNIFEASEPNVLSEEEEPDLSSSTNTTHRTSSVFSSIGTPELGSPVQFAQVHDFQSFGFDELRTGDEVEEVFEAVSGEDKRNSNLGLGKLSREERIRLMREKRAEKEVVQESEPVQSLPMISGGSNHFDTRFELILIDRAQRRYHFDQDAKRSSTVYPPRL